MNNAKGSGNVSNRLLTLYENRQVKIIEIRSGGKKRLHILTELRELQDTDRRINYFWGI